MSGIKEFFWPINKIVKILILSEFLYFAYLFLCELSKRTKISIKYLDFLEALEVKSISYLKSIKENIKKRLFIIFLIMGLKKINMSQNI